MTRETSDRLRAEINSLKDQIGFYQTELENALRQLEMRNKNDVETGKQREPSDS